MWLHQLFSNDSRKEDLKLLKTRGFFHHYYMWVNDRMWFGMMVGVVMGEDMKLARWGLWNV
jgi:hypothetical protein